MRHLVGRLDAATVRLTSNLHRATLATTALQNVGASSTGRAPRTPQFKR